jgi:hypothetical protein
LASVLKSLVSNVSVDPNSSITSIDWLFWSEWVRS